MCVHESNYYQNHVQKGSKRLKNIAYFSHFLSYFFTNFDEIFVNKIKTAKKADK